MAAFRDLLVAIGTPGIYQIAASLSPSDAAAYVSAFIEAYRQSLFGTGLVALVAAPIAWIALGTRDPLRTVYDHLDERTEVATGHRNDRHAATTRAAEPDDAARSTDASSR